MALLPLMSFLTDLGTPTPLYLDASSHPTLFNLENDNTEAKREYVTPAFEDEPF